MRPQAPPESAATAVTAGRVSAAVDPPFEVVADRPFQWAMEDAASGTLLFAGVVDDPTQEETD